LKNGEKFMDNVMPTIDADLQAQIDQVCQVGDTLNEAEPFAVDACHGISTPFTPGLTDRHDRTALCCGINASGIWVALGSS
jgi:hypothetical protein